MILRIRHRRQGFRAVLQSVGKGTQVEVALYIHEMQAHGWSKGIVTMLFIRVVRGEKAGAQHHEVDCHQGQQRNPQFLLASHLSLHPDTRIAKMEQQIGQQVSRNQENRRTQNSRHHHVQVALKNGLQQQGTNPRPAHDDFDQE